MRWPWAPVTPSTLLPVPNKPYGFCLLTLGSPSLVVTMVSMDAKQHRTRLETELRSCVNVEVAVLDSPSLIVRTVSVDGKQH